jgi:hypothetical protein
VAVAIAGPDIAAAMGNAEAIGCKVVAQDTDVTLMEDFASAGDGHDVNCIMTAL